MRTHSCRFVAAVLLLSLVGCNSTLIDWKRWRKDEPPPLSEEYRPYQPTVQALVFSPDGEYLASGHQYRGVPYARSQFLLVPATVKIWHIDGIDCMDVAMFRTEHGLMGAGDGLRFTPDGKTLNVLSKDGLLFWDMEQQALRKSEIEEPITMTADGKRVAVKANRDGSPPKDFRGGDCINILDADTDEIIQRILPDHQISFPDCFSPDGRLLLIGWYRPTSEEVYESLPMEIWDLCGGRLQCRLKSDGDQHWWSYGFSPDGKLLARVFTPQRSSISLWDTTTGERKKILWDNIENFRCLAFSPDGRWLAVGCSHTGDENKSHNRTYARLLVWDLAEDRQYASVVDRSSWGITAVAFSPDSKRIATGDGNGAIKFWEIDKLTKKP